MAYKFQLGAFTASGSIKAEEGLDAGDSNITNVADIAVDSISADGNDLEIDMTDNRATAFVIKEGSNVYFRARTSNSSERVEFLKELSGSTGVDTNLGGNLTVNNGTISGAEIVVGAGGLDLQNLSDTAIDVAADSLVFKDADDFAKVDTIADLATGMAGTVGNTAIAATSGVFSVDIGNTTAAAIQAGDEILFDRAGATRKESINDVATLFAGDGLAASSGVIEVQVSGALAIKSDKLALSSSVAGAGLAAAVDGAAQGVVTALEIDMVGTAASTTIADSDLILIDDGANGTIRKMTRANFIESAALDAINIDGGAIDGVTLGTNSAVTTGVITTLTASHALITNLDAVTINSVTQTEETLEVKDKLIVTSLSASSTNSSGGGLQIGGGQNSAGHAGVIYNHATTGLRLLIGSTAQVELRDGVLLPVTNNDIDLGSSDNKYKDLHLDGDAKVDSITLNGTAISATGGEINIIDGDATVNASVTIADTDGIILNDAGTMKQIRASNLKTYISAATLDVTSGSNGVTLSEGVNYFGAHGGAISANLPNNPSVGQSFRIKAGADCSSTNTLTINPFASNTIDGASSIVLESPFAAVECVYVVSGSWRVF